MNLSDNLLFNYVVAYLSGLAVSFSPCVYPLMPVTAGIIASVNTIGTKVRGLIISLVYVCGLAVTYSSLAVFAALTGKVFGQFQHQPFVYLFVGVVLLMFALSLFDLIRFPDFGGTIQKRMRGKGLVAIFFLGMTTGLAVSPCTAPILGTLLFFVASRQNVVYGASLLFIFAYGVGTSLILVGTFSGMVSNLPRSGPWLIRVKQFCGAVILLIAGYFFLKAGRMML
jgi:cytochrome c-type biogenesis protein